MATLPEPIVSGLVPSRSPAALVSPSSTDADVVYVSFGPGSISAGRSLLIRNLRTGWSETEPLVDGGLDPVPIPAQVGDTLRLVATDSAGNSAAYVSLVKPLKPPVVVRTVPPQRKTDVPLNAAIVVVFSEPMDSVTVDSSTILLRHAGVADSGRVTLSGDRLVATFTPDRPLAPLAVYDLIVTSGVHDQSGMAMDPSLIVQFSTADATSLI
ncbi:MAG TPA: Ig-like domain-containing protein, partial [Steroidobacteraceae bacterium]